MWVAKSSVKPSSRNPPQRPPARSLDSTIVVRTPAATSRAAQASPPIPAPITSACGAERFMLE